MRITNLWAGARQFSWSLGIPVGMTAYFSQHPEWHGDLQVFRGVTESLRHPPWARWIFALLALPPEPVAYIGLSLVCSASFYLAVRLFGGRHWLLFTSFAFGWTLLYGQIDGLVVGGLALAWWALLQKRPVLLGAGLLLALVQPQLSLPMALLLWFWSPSRTQSLLGPTLALALTFVQWGWWVPGWLRAIQDTSDLVYLSRNLSLWPTLGPWALAIWALILPARLPRPRKLLAVAVGTVLSVPYFPLPSAVLLLVIPTPVWAWLLLQAPLLGGAVGYWVYEVSKLASPALLAWVFLPELRLAWTRLKESEGVTRYLENRRGQAG